MMRSMFSSVSGMKAHQLGMDVIGNNIANVNTVGYKASRTTFQEIFSQTLSGAGAPDPNNGKGGTNPMQIGLGMSISAVETMTTRGSVQRTDSPTDLAIDGEGFFIVRGGDEGIYQFTRAGNFSLDKAGNLVTAAGLNVQGWMKYEKNVDGEYIFDMSEPIKPINFYEDEYNKNKRIIAAKATGRAVLSGNLDATEKAVGGNTGAAVSDGSTTAGLHTIVDKDGDGIPDDGTTDFEPHFIMPVTVFDSLGNEYKININFWKNFVETPPASGTPPVQPPPETSWYWAVDGGAGISAGTSTGFIKFDADGKIVTNDTAFSTNPPVELTPGKSVGAEPFKVALDFTKISMYAADNSVKPSNVDGYPSGNLVTFSIGGDGTITGIYSNGRQQPLGMVGLATFENPAGLQRSGNNLFIPTTNSGDFHRAIRPSSEDAGSLSPGTLEMSNVDLAKQFTEMIIIQRGFQANSRLMTTSDEILQELTNLKR